MLNPMKTEANSSSSSSSSPMTATTTTPAYEIVRQQRFEVAPRYTDLKFVGEGAYGLYHIRSSLSGTKFCCSFI